MPVSNVSIVCYVFLYFAVTSFFLFRAFKSRCSRWKLLIECLLGVASITWSTERPYRLITTLIGNLLVEGKIHYCNVTCDLNIILQLRTFTHPCWCNVVTNYSWNPLTENIGLCIISLHISKCIRAIRHTDPKDSNHNLESKLNKNSQH